MFNPTTNRSLGKADKPSTETTTADWSAAVMTRVVVFGSGENTVSTRVPELASSRGRGLMAKIATAVQAAAVAPVIQGVRSH